MYHLNEPVIISRDINVGSERNKRSRITFQSLFSYVYLEPVLTFHMRTCLYLQTQKNIHETNKLDERSKIRHNLLDQKQTKLIKQDWLVPFHSFVQKKTTLLVFSWLLLEWLYFYTFLKVLGNFSISFSKCWWWSLVLQRSPQFCHRSPWFHCNDFH